MGTFIAVGAVLGGAAALGAVSMLGAKKLFDMTIPRQKEIKVDLNEFADMEKWEEYKKIIGPRKKWLMAQNLEKITISARDGIKLHAYYLPAEKSSDRLVIGLHGYTSCGLSDFCSHTYYFHRMGFDYLIPDHRGHGESDGDYIGFGILDRFDCRAWIDYVDKRFDGEKQILLHGTSMGATTALMTVGAVDLPESVKAVVSDCAFTSPYDIFRHILKKNYHLPAHPIMDINDRMCRKTAGYGFRDYSTLTAVQNTRCPVLFIHGKEDKFVPTWMTDENYKACASPKEIWFCDGAEHGSSYYEKPNEYEEKIAHFVQQWILKEKEERDLL